MLWDRKCEQQVIYHIDFSNNAFTLISTEECVVFLRHCLNFDIMYGKIKRFEREIPYYVAISSFLLFWAWLQMGDLKLKNIVKLEFWILLIITIIEILIVIILFDTKKPNFWYSICIEGNIIIFEISEKDHRKIKKTLMSLAKTKIIYCWMTEKQDCRLCIIKMYWSF